jgi:diketogulonate reductase-like aldo/keto reductase
LLHWPDEITDLSGVVAAFENLRSKGKIRAWGVSNFNVNDMGRLLNVPHGDSCATNQVPYSLGDRAIEHDLLPWCAQHAMPVMAYSPLGGASSTLLRDPTVARIGAAHGCSPAAVALAWTLRDGNVIAIPESGNVAHVRENAVALSLALTSEELHALDAAHPPPKPRLGLRIKTWHRRYGENSRTVISLIGVGHMEGNRCRAKFQTKRG